jgi:polyhydroxyalkanoate synthesis regulator protein
MMWALTKFQGGSMKFLLAALVAISASAFAGHHEKMMEDMKKMPFDQHKKMMQEKLEKKSAMVEEARKCVDASMDNNALMECHKKMMDEKHAMKDEMHDKMKDMKKKM